MENDSFCIPFMIPLIPILVPIPPKCDAKWPRNRNHDSGTGRDDVHNFYLRRSDDAAWFRGLFGPCYAPSIHAPAMYSSLLEGIPVCAGRSPSSIVVSLVKDSFKG